MIIKLKRKFIILATISMFVLMSTLCGIMNAINYSMVVKESDSTINLLIHPDDPAHDNTPPPSNSHDDIKNPVHGGMSPEIPYESRYFTVTVSESGEIVKTDLSKILSVDDSSVSDYTEKALSSSRSRGFIKQFRFAKRTRESGRFPRRAASAPDWRPPFMAEHIISLLSSQKMRFVTPMP